MNERIQALMAQAVTFHLDPDSNAYEAQVSPEDMELFAELIVRECVDIAYEHDEPKMSGPGMIIAGRIEKHFGVSE